MGKLKRREFIQRSGKIIGGIAGTAVLGSLPMINSGCKSATGPDEHKNVTVTLKYYNHTQGPLGEKTYTSNGALDFTISIASLGYRGIDSQRIAVRKSAEWGTMGNCIGFSKTGQITLEYPASDEVWEVYLMNAGNNANYSLHDLWCDLGQSTGRLRYGRVVHCQREDRGGIIGPSEPILEALRQINDEILSHTWKRYGSLDFSDPAFFGIGYGVGSGLPGHPDAWEVLYEKGEPTWIRVDPAIIQAYKDRLNCFSLGLFSILTKTSEIDISDPAIGGFSPQGRDILAYAFVKDESY